MKNEVRPLSFWTTVRLLLRVARRRAAGRRERQQELLQNKSERSSDWSGIGFAFTVLVMAFLNVGAAFVAQGAVASGERLTARQHGRFVVSSAFLTEVQTAEKYSNYSDPNFEHASYSIEAARIAEVDGGNEAEIEKRLRASVREHGSRDLISKNDVSFHLRSQPVASRLSGLLGSVVLFWWAAMLVCQGEGLELDIQRRRHPMWEFLFAHPVLPGAIFLSEMLSPIAANPMYWGGPLFAGFLYGFVYGVEGGIIATVLIGIPLTIATACLGKATEIAITLRLPTRSRGAMIGLMSWFGYASMMLFFIIVAVSSRIVTALAPILQYLTFIPWPWLRWFLGGRADGSFSYIVGVLACWMVSAITIAGAVWFSVWGAQQGLSGNVASDAVSPSRPSTAKSRFGKDPLYRKELLWFARDRSAIVQTILVPVTVAGFQIFNFRTIVSHAQGAWNYLSAAAILFGTYFLWVLGPKSLTSEGAALWIALTWPRGLESLLKAKAWLWSLLSSGMVVIVLCYAAYLFPADIGAITLVGIGWFFFSRSMAEKTVTLVSVTSSSGEKEQIPWGRRWAAQLGMLTFAIGVLTQQWNLAVVGIVYSYVTAAAMWENFRARLPFLYDPWSERVPPPPTLMHAMVSISILVEAGAIFTGMVVALAGRENIAVAQAIGYAICAVVVSIGVASFLSDRDVTLRDVWCWDSRKGENSWWRVDVARRNSLVRALLLGILGGLALGVFAVGYTFVLQNLPGTADLIRKAREEMAKVPNLRISYAFIAVIFAPFAEEYLFRGLLYRALDREWGGWRAVIGSAAFFAIYHPTMAWLPVAILGAANAILFKKTGRLAPAVALHMVYNAVVLSRTFS